MGNAYSSERPIGASADASELEYISALHQTDKELREDGSISAVDIQYFLSSRYGIRMTEDEISERVLKGFQCTKESLSSEDQEYLDLMEIACILFIPSLLKASAAQTDNSEELATKVELPPSGMLEDSLRFLNDAAGFSESQPLTANIVKRFFLAYGENELSQDENLIQEMLEVVLSDRDIEEDDTVLDCQKFALALTKDVQNYDIENETKVSTIFNDVFEGMSAVEKVSKKESKTELVAENGVVSERDVIEIQEQASKGDEERVEKPDKISNVDNDPTEKPDQVAKGDGQDAETMGDLEPRDVPYEETNDEEVVEVQEAVTMGENKEDVEDQAILMGDQETMGDLESRDKQYEVTNDEEIVEVQEAVTMGKNKEDVENQAVLMGDQEETVVKQDKGGLKDKKDLNLIFTAPWIDTTVGPFRSKQLMVALWATALISYFAYFFSFGESQYECEEPLEYSYEAPWSANGIKVACESWSRIVTWLFFFAAISVYGMIFVGLGGLGNYVDCKYWFLPLLGFVAVFLISIWPYALTDEFTTNWVLNNIAFIVAMITCIFQFSNFLGMVLPSRVSDKYSLFKKWKAGSSGPTERREKMAASHKLNLMAKNALDISQQIEFGEDIIVSSYGQALTNYAEHVPRYEKIGFLWVYKGIWNKSLLIEDGMQYSVRVLAGNIAMIFATIVTLFVGIVIYYTLTTYYDNNVDKRGRASSVVGLILNRFVNQDVVDDLVSRVSGIISRFVGLLGRLGALNVNCTAFDEQGEGLLDTLCNTSASPGVYECSPNATIGTYLCALANATEIDDYLNLALLNAAGLNVTDLFETAKENMQEAIDVSIDSVFPTSRYMVTIPCIVLTILGTAMGLFISVTYIPSVTCTILKARSGVIKSLHDKEFNYYRVAPDLVCVLTGSFFWGTLVGSVIFGVLIGLILFFFLWQATAYFAQLAVASIIGIAVTVTIRFGIVLCFRCSFWQAFYRKRPAAANLTLLGLEWATFALSAVFVVVRLIKFLLAAVLSLGRIDYPLLAKGVAKIGPVPIDRYPSIHFQDLLSHEAHRHPYIELLGGMYLMKLRYGLNFGTRAGSAWRLLFLYSLLPWFRKYRSLTRPEMLSGSMTLKAAGNSKDNPFAMIAFMNKDVLSNLAQKMDKNVSNIAQKMGRKDSASSRKDGASESDRIPTDESEKKSVFGTFASKIRSSAPEKAGTKEDDAQQEDTKKDEWAS